MMVLAKAALGALVLLAGAVPALASDITQLRCLYSLYDDLHGENWHFNKGWPAKDDRHPTTDNPCAGWHGIGCAGDSVISITLSGNNLQGTLPSCLDVFPLMDLDLSGNPELTGTMGELPTTLTGLHYKYTSISSLPTNICSLTRLTALRTEWTRVSESTFPLCLLNFPGLSTLDVLDGHMRGDDSQSGYAPTRFAGSRFQVGGNDVRLNIDFTGLSEQGSSYFDISDSNSTGTGFEISRFLKAFPSVSDANLQRNAIRGVFDAPGRDFLLHPIKTLDVSDNLISGVLQDGLLTKVVSTLPKRMLAFSFARNRITGLAPLMSEVEDLLASHPDLKILDMDGNPFLCRPDADSVFSCTALRIDSIEELEIGNSGPCHVVLGVSTSDLVNPINPEDLLADLSLLAADYSTGEPAAEKAPLAEAVDSISADPQNPRLLTISATFTHEQAETLGLVGRDLTRFDFGLAFAGLEVSTGNSTAPVAGQPSRSRLGARSAATSSASSTPSAPAAPLTAVNRLKMEISGFSRCPDYVDINEELVYPLFERYPELYSILDYSFLTLTVPCDRYSTGVLAMHGQTESYGDIALVCFADTVSDSFYFDRFTRCLYRDSAAVPFNVEACINEVAPGYADRILQCISSDHGSRLVAQGRERSIELSASWSPVLYLDGKVSCIWGDICQFYGVEGLRSAICDAYTEKFHTVPNVCQ